MLKVLNHYSPKNAMHAGFNEEQVKLFLIPLICLKIPGICCIQGRMEYLFEKIPYLPLEVDMVPYLPSKNLDFLICHRLYFLCLMCHCR
jgi:hypothetical protein